MARILIVDDDLAIRSIVADALRQDGYDVESVANGRQALTAFSHTRPDVVVLDLQMPGMDGPSLVHTLRAQTCRGIVPWWWSPARPTPTRRARGWERGPA
jgi:CheY-like chemotaxis protein